MSHGPRMITGKRFTEELRSSYLASVPCRFAFVLSPTSTPWSTEVPSIPLFHIFIQQLHQLSASHTSDREPIFRNANLHARLLSATALTLFPYWIFTTPAPSLRLALLARRRFAPSNQDRTPTRSSKSTPALNYIESGCPIPPSPLDPATLQATTIVPPRRRPIQSLPLRHL